jgi:hypothetical protein
MLVENRVADQKSVASERRVVSFEVFCAITREQLICNGESSDVDKCNLRFHRFEFIRRIFC